MKRKGSTSHLFDRICHLFNPPSPNASFNFHTHHVLYTYPEPRKNQVPNVRIRKTDPEDGQRPLMIQSCALDGTLLDVLDDIFNKLHLTYQDNILEYIKTEQKHRIEKQVVAAPVQIQLFDDEDATMTTTNSLQQEPEEATKMKFKLFDEDSDDEILRPTTKPSTVAAAGDMESSSGSSSEEETMTSRRKKKQFAFLEDSDDELEMDRSISNVSAAGADSGSSDEGTEDEEMDSYMKSKAEETQNYIKHTKVRGQPARSSRKKKKGATTTEGSSQSEAKQPKTDKQKKRKAANEWNKIKGLLKEKEDEKKRKIE